MPASIFNGTAVKLLKNILRFKSGTQIITSDSADPTSVAKAGNIGDLYQQAGTSKWFSKTDSGTSTNWTKLQDSTDVANKANTSLNNLTTTSINQSLLPASNLGFNLGSTALRWNVLNVSQLFAADGTTTIDNSNRNLVKPSGANAISWSGAGGAINMNTHRLSNVVDPTNPQDVATKNYVDTASTGANTALSNLTTTSINQNLLPGSNLGFNLGSTSLRWNVLNVSQLFAADGTTTIDNSNRNLVKPSGANAISWSGAGGAINMNTHRLSNVVNPTNAQDAATKNYVDSATAGSSTLTLENHTGGTLTKFTPVSINSSGFLSTVDVSTEANAMAAIGVVASDILDNTSGAISTFGILKDVTTSATFGDVVYIDKTGGVTNTKPSIGVGGFVAGDWAVRLGVISKNVTNNALKDLILSVTIVGQL